MQLQCHRACIKVCSVEQQYTRMSKPFGVYGRIYSDIALVLEAIARLVKCVVTGSCRLSCRTHVSIPCATDRFVSDIIATLLSERNR